MSSNSFRDRVLPLAIFPALSAVAVRLLMLPLIEAKLDLDTGCRALGITGKSAIDNPLCSLVDFFTVLMHDTVGQSFLTYAMGISLPLALIPAVEAYRPGQTKLLKYPMAWLLVSQVVSIGITMPLYWMISVLTNGPRKIRHGTTATYRQADVLALAFGLVVGAVVPSVSMMVLDDPVVTALWQIYPAYVAIAQFIHLQVRPHTQHSHSGYTALQVIYFATLLLSSSVHMSTIWPMLKDIESLKTLLIPTLGSLPSSANAAQFCLNFLKWDVTLAYLSTIIASFWSADSLQQGTIMAFWYVLSIPLLGFGASVMGVALWRNGLL
ncbi:hypothetical protein CPB83DRAFT_807700 [Crepidotus variabilis]|uniref:Uncharacterized protein n=1 Tax=Crepidotus variabilis TaxID=179855 RepID=A0A9P6EP67_9AGAR|nr:hypothetical protein CPB83DRAFT_807700 [Crepidotus variabilis]